MKMETADFGHVCRKFSETVYEPSEDTFLLLDALEKDLGNLARLNPCFVLEIGSGSGVVITSLAKCLGDGVFYMSTDINSDAARATLETAVRNHVLVEVVNTDIVKGLLPRLRSMVDLLLFNPPYVPTTEEEMTSSKLSAAWAGGPNGRMVMDRLFPLVDQLLSPSGVFYLVVVQENQLDDIRSVMSAHNFISEIVQSRRSGAEKLSVMKFYRSVTDETIDTFNKV